MSSADGRPGPIAVVGATGRQGSAVVRHLLDDGWRVRALTRDPTSPAARSLAGRGADCRRVELDDVDSLRAAFVGAHGVYDVQNPVTSSVEAEVRHGRNVAEAAAACQVEHVVYGGAGVGDEPTGVGSWDSKLVVARAFRDRELLLTVLRPMAFMELMTDKAYYPGVSVWHVMPRLMGASRPVGWICTDDLGAAAARVFADPARWAGSTLDLLADVRSVEECRAIWEEVTGRPPRRLPMPVWLFERVAGTDLTTMWRWLETARFPMTTATTLELVPGALGVRDWLVRTLASRPRR